MSGVTKHAYVLCEPICNERLRRTQKMAVSLKIYLHSSCTGKNERKLTR
jgi:hypothetical protein